MELLGIPVDFVLFAITLIGVALFHHQTLRVALTGLAVVTLYKLAFTGFKTGPGLGGLGLHLAHEWVILANLLGLLLGFALLSDHFERSHIPLELPRWLPDDWKGGLALLFMIFVLSSFLDNAPTYLVFFELAGGDPAQLMTTGALTLAAISAGAVFMGANSYIGNAPNFMVYAIARESGVKMPSFFGYMLWSGSVLIPAFLLTTWIFFSR